MIRLSLLLLAACSSGPREGIAVGNPGQGMTVQLEAGNDVTTVQGSLPMGKLTATTCSGVPHVLTGLTTLEIGRNNLPLPPGELCELTLVPGGPLAAQGRSRRGGTFSIVLDVPEITVVSEGGFRTDVPVLLVLGPGPWLSAEALQIGEDEVRSVQPGDELHDLFADLVRHQSLLCEDLDGDERRESGDRILARGTDLQDTGMVPLSGWQESSDP